MYSLRNGTITVCARPAGLADSVQHFDPDSGIGRMACSTTNDAPGGGWAIGPRSIVRVPKSWHSDAKAMAQGFFVDSAIVHTIRLPPNGKRLGERQEI